MKTRIILCLTICTSLFTACDVEEVNAERDQAIAHLSDDLAGADLLIEDDSAERSPLTQPKGHYDFANPEPEPAAVSCTGYPSGDWCMARCSNGGWYAVGHWTAIPYGNCTAAGQNFCGYYGMGHTGACWGHP